jgi:hypothetical protein
LCKQTKSPNFLVSKRYYAILNAATTSRYCTLLSSQPPEVSLQQSNVQQSNVQQSNVKQSNVKQSNVKQSEVKQQSNVKQQTIVKQAPQMTTTGDQSNGPQFPGEPSSEHCVKL